MSENWQQVKEVFAAALERAPADRRAYLDQVCLDPSLLREVEELIMAHEEAGDSFLEHPAFESDLMENDEGTRSVDRLASSAIDQAEDFKGTARFEIQRRLGAGGFGVVYRAYDQKQECLIALKALRRLDARALLRFKKEFRTFADVTHPNLVALYEFLSDAGQWFFTMELIEGANLIHYLQEGARPASLDSAGTPTNRETPGSGLGRDSEEAAHRDKRESPFTRMSGARFYDRDVPQNSPLTRSLEHWDRVRLSFAQLAEGLCALHERGLVHRDLKPSNVLVTGEGRVVLLDFGLVSSLTTSESTQLSAIVGTPHYMSPEQCAGRPVSEASDWYSLGIILYETLAGRLPFDGHFLEVMMEKQRSEPTALQELVAGVPEDLWLLCQELLRTDPKARPFGRDVLSCLTGRTETRPPDPISSYRVKAPPLLVGRKPHLESLLKAFQSSKRGHAVTVCVRGETGVGKSTLVSQFVRDLRQRDPDAVVLAGKCYERESIPYKALDSLVDSLSQYLKRLPSSESERILPRDAAVLARLFPVLREVGAVAAARRRLLDIPDSQELRRRAFAALRELLARLADQRPLVLFIDDFQWGDSDSGALLGDLLRPPDPPALLLIVCFRKEEAETNSLLAALHSALAGDDVRDIEVEQLSLEESCELALALLDTEQGDRPGRAEVLARESGGNPFFLHELARYARLRGDQPGTDLHAPTLDGAIQARISHLPQNARRVLEVVAVAGRPISLQEAKRAAGLSGSEQNVLTVLRNERLLWTRGLFEASEVEIYHDRIRQAVVTHLTSADLRSHHRRLAETLEASERADLEALTSHFQGAGDFERAAFYAVEAAKRADDALAFDRSAHLYRLALELQPGDPRVRTLHAKLGEALANAGRGAEAAEAYVRAADGAEAGEALDFRRRGAEQLLKSGRIDEGVAILERVLAGIGMRLPETPRRALLSIATRRAHLRLRGLGFRERDATQVSLERLTHIDTCWAAAVGLGVVDPIRGADFQARHLQLALRAGEPYRVARALAIEVGFSGTGGLRNHTRTQELLRSTMALAERVGHPHALGLATLNAGIAARLEGRFREGVKLCDRAEEILRERCTGVAWERDTAEIFSLTCLVMLGEWQELARRLPTLIKEVEARGDLYPSSYMRTRIQYLLCLAADEPERACEEEKRGVAQWSQQGFFTLHYSDLMARAEIELYRGDSQAAWSYLQQRWPDLTQSLLPRVQSVFIESRHLRARCALAKAIAGQKAYFLEIAERDARTIERERTRWGLFRFYLIRAAVAATRGDKRAATRILASAEKAFVSVEMGLFSAAARRRRGEILGGDEGRALVQAADAQMAAQRITHPERVAGMLAPGQWA